MKYAMSLLTILVLGNGLNAQVEADIRLSMIGGDEHRQCFNLDIRQLGDEDITIASQNYRFFYNSKTLWFDDSSWSLGIFHDMYTYRLVQHSPHIDASAVDVLSFDHDLGFINVSVFHSSDTFEGMDLSPHSWATISTFCFDIIDPAEQRHQIVIARPELTESYGRAYTEMTYMAEQGRLQKLSLRSVSDFH